MLALLFGSIFGLCGLVCILIARTAFARDRAIAAWPRALGTITRSSVSSHEATTRDQEGYYREHVVHELIVLYTYTVNGRVYEGDRVARFAPPSNKKPDLAAYPPGKSVSVYYDPQDPATAYLEVRRSTGATILAIMGGVFLAIGLVVAILVTL